MKIAEVIKQQNPFFTKNKTRGDALCTRCRELILDCYFHKNPEFIKGYSKHQDATLLYETLSQDDSEIADAQTNKGISIELLGKLVAIYNDQFTVIARKIKNQDRSIKLDDKQLARHCAETSKQLFFNKDPVFIKGYKSKEFDAELISTPTTVEVSKPKKPETSSRIAVADIGRFYGESPDYFEDIKRKVEEKYGPIKNCYSHC